MSERKMVRLAGTPGTGLPGTLGTKYLQHVPVTGTFKNVPHISQQQNHLSLGTTALDTLALSVKL